MSLSIFGDKKILPNDEMLGEALSELKNHWDSIKKHIENTYDKISGEWKYYSKSSGWTFVIKSGKRTLVYLIPTEECIKASFVFGEKAVEAAQKADLPEAILKRLLESKAYVEGRSIMVDVENDKHIDIVKKLLKIKTDN